MPTQPVPLFGSWHLPLSGQHFVLGPHVSTPQNIVPVPEPAVPPVL
jgi:hypothetical protein